MLCILLINFMMPLFDSSTYIDSANYTDFLMLNIENLLYIFYNVATRGNLPSPKLTLLLPTPFLYTENVKCLLYTYQHRSMSFLFTVR
jgi:hypothetical protein